MDSSLQSSSDSFQFEASGSSFGLPACNCEVGSFESLEDLSFFVQSQDTSQYPSTPLAQASETTTKIPTAVPIRETQVKFSTVKTRTYGVVVGDSPSCADGLPISLDWNYNPKIKIEPIKVEDALKGKRAISMSRLEGELEVEELPQLKRPKSLVSQAA
jgi:hypothetical protein